MMDQRLTPPMFAALPRDPFVGWLHAHDLLHPGVAWSCHNNPATGERVFRRSCDVGKYWPADRIPGPLVIRPKREACK